MILLRNHEIMSSIDFFELILIFKENAINFIYLDYRVLGHPLAFCTCTLHPTLGRLSARILYSTYFFRSLSYKAYASRDRANLS